MLRWAEHEFKLNQPDKNGVTEREHLEQVERQTGRRPVALESPTDFPHALSYLWSAFIDLSSGRSMGFSGPNPITYTEIKAWSDLTETPIQPFEVSVIKKLDNIYLRAANG